jgi:hypothetical protein
LHIFSYGFNRIILFRIFCERETAMESMALLEKLGHLNRKALEGGGPDRIKKQHDSGKLTARERAELIQIDKADIALRCPIRIRYFNQPGL